MTPADKHGSRALQGVHNGGGQHSLNILGGKGDTSLYICDKSMADFPEANSR